MWINAKQMHQLQGREDIGRRKETLCDELRIEIIPLLTRYIRTLWILCDFRGLLYVGKESVQNRNESEAGEELELHLNSPQTHHANVERVAQEINKVPHVTQITSHPHGKYLLHLLPHKTDDIEHHEQLQLAGCLATLTL